MKKIYLIKSYDDHEPGSIITVSNNVAFGLIDSGKARDVKGRDFLVKTGFGESKAMDMSHQGKIPRKNKRRRR